MPGLKKQLLFLIKSRGEISIDNIESICHENHYKTSTAYRKLRELTAVDLVSPIYNKKNTAIIGYKPFTKLEQLCLEK